MNAQGRLYGNALYAASFNGHEKVIQILVNKGADAMLKKEKMAFLKENGSRHLGIHVMNPIIQLCLDLMLSI